MCSAIGSFYYEQHMCIAHYAVFHNVHCSVKYSTKYSMPSALGRLAFTLAGSMTEECAELYIENIVLSGGQNCIKNSVLSGGQNCI